MSKWKETKIIDIADFNLNSINKDFGFNVIEYIDISSVEKGRLLCSQKVKLEEAPSRARRRIKKNDILISSVRPNLEHYYFVKDCSENTIVSTGFVVITPKKNTHPYFLYCLLTTKEFTQYLTMVANSHTSTYPSFNSNIISDSILPIPDFGEQKEIADVLSCLDDKIENLRKQNQTLEKIAQTLFKHWFIDFEFPNENGEPYKSSGGAMKPSELGEIPEGWRVGKLGDVTRLGTGKGLKKDDFNDNGYYPVLGANGEMGRTNNFLIEEQSILTGRVGTIGTVSINYVKAWISDNVIIINPDRILFYYIYFYLRKTNLKNLNRGSTQPLITQGDLKQIDVIIPNEKITKDFQEFCQMLFWKKRLNDKTIQSLTKTRDTLLPKLMSGKLRIQEENIIEEGNETS